MDHYDFEEADFLDQWAMEDALQDTVYQDGELEGEEFGPWRYLDPPESIHIKDSDDIDKQLLAVAKQEMTSVARRIKETLKGRLANVCNVTNLFIRGLVAPLAACINTSLPQEDVATNSDVMEFIRTFSTLSVYRCSPSFLWDRDVGEIAFPLGVDRDKHVFKKCLNAISRGRRVNSSQHCSSVWGEPFQEDDTVRQVEKAAGASNSRLGFVKDVTRLSIDDDQFRLCSSRVEDAGFVRVQIPNKAYGPVRTLFY